MQTNILTHSVLQPTGTYRGLLIPREGKFGDEEWFISASEHKVAEYLTLGVGISSTYAASTETAGSISLSSLLCLTVHFSARIFDLERYESRRSEGRKREKRGVALIHSTVSASLPPLSALPPGDVLPLRLRRSAKISLVSSFPTFHSWSALPDRERRRNAMLAIHFYLRRSRQVYGL